VQKKNEEDEKNVTYPKEKKKQSQLWRVKRIKKKMSHYQIGKT